MSNMSPPKGERTDHLPVDKCLVYQGLVGFHLISVELRVLEGAITCYCALLGWKRLCRVDGSGFRGFGFQREASTLQSSVSSLSETAHLRR